MSLETLAALPGPPASPGQTSNWHGHIPFARWLTRETRPKNYVELGVFAGDSYLAVCEAVRKNGLTTSCFGVDSWEGDEHAGAIVAETYAALSAFHDAQYGSFSKLMKMYFDDALSSFEDGTIDLLHIDGLHTYEAVRHDFETWLPKMSRRGVVLFHDAVVKELGFGVYRFWDEVKDRHPSFLFENSHGLGVLAVGQEPPEAVRWMTSLQGDEERAFRHFFQHLGAALVAQWHLSSGPEAGYSYDAGTYDSLEMEQRARQYDPWNASAIHELEAMKASTSWRLTAPLRRLMDMARGTERHR